MSPSKGDFGKVYARGWGIGTVCPLNPAYIRIFAPATAPQKNELASKDKSVSSEVDLRIGVSKDVENWLTKIWSTNFLSLDLLRV
jgi:hypothetical protein